MKDKDTILLEEAYDETSKSFQRTSPWPIGTPGGTSKDTTPKNTAMTQEKLLQVLSDVWNREISADDAFDMIWGEPFEGQTQFI